MSSIFEAILETLPQGWQPRQLYIGVNWTVSVVEELKSGRIRAGLAATPAAELVAAHSRFQVGDNELTTLAANDLARLVHSSDLVETAVGLATLNALLEPDPALIQDIDAGDWLVEHGRNRKVAVIGRFPLIEELKPVASELWVLELNPLPGEYQAEDAPKILPQAEIVAITGSTLINHTLDALLALIPSSTKVILLGPSTPLTPILFDYGVDLLSGVQVADLEGLLESCREGVSFRKMKGLRRVSILKS